MRSNGSCVLADDFVYELFELLGLPLPPKVPTGFEGAEWIDDSRGASFGDKSWDPRTARYVVGGGDGFFGIWDRENPGPPIERFEGPDAWRQAMDRVPELLFPPPPEFEEATLVSDSGIQLWNRKRKMNLTRARYVIGRGRDFIGIWDRKKPGPPIARFPKDPDGTWQSAEEYARLMKLPPPER